MAHKTGSGSSKNGRDSHSKRLGIKQNHNQIKSISIAIFFLCLYILKNYIYITTIFYYIFKKFTESEYTHISGGNYDFFFKKNRIILENFISIKNKINNIEINNYFSNINYINNFIFFIKKNIKYSKLFFKVFNFNEYLLNGYPHNIYDIYKFRPFEFKKKHKLTTIVLFWYNIYKRERIRKRIKYLLNRNKSINLIVLSMYILSIKIFISYFLKFEIPYRDHFPGYPIELFYDIEENFSENFDIMKNQDENNKIKFSLEDTLFKYNIMQFKKTKFFKNLINISYIFLLYMLF